MAKVKDILDLFESDIQIVKNEHYIIDIDFKGSIDESRKYILSEDVLNEEIEYIECEKDKAFLHIGERG